MTLVFATNHYGALGTVFHKRVEKAIEYLMKFLWTPQYPNLWQFSDVTVLPLSALPDK